VQKQQAEILELKSYQEEHQGLSAKVQEQQAEIQELKCGFEQTRVALDQISRKI